MALTSLPKVGTGEALGPIKSNARAVVDIAKESDAGEWNAAAAALQGVCETVGLSDGSTPGSIESERLRSWAPSFVAGDNASAVTLVHATQRSEGDYVTLRGALLITAVAAGPATASAPLPVNEDGTDTVGIASGMGSSPALAVCIAATTSLSVTVEAEAAGDCVVAFDVQYKKAP